MAQEEQQKQNSRKGDFSVGSVPVTVLKLGIPIAMAEVVHVLYNIVDRMFIGHISGVGTAALSGVGIAFPLISLITAFANLCGTGGNPLCSMARGRGDNEKARRIMETAFTMLIGLGALLTVFFLIFARPVLIAVGGDEETLPYALSYFRIYVAGTVFVLISLGMNPFINGMGFSRVGMGTVLIGAILNTILDPLFIFVFHMGVRGAAIATVISQLVSTVWVVRFLTGKKTLLRITRLHLDWRLALSIVKLGATGFMFKFSNSVAQTVVNLTLKQFGGLASTLYIGAFSIINSLREVISQPINGINSAGVPVMSFNYGAGNYDRVRRVIRFMLASALTYNLILWLIVFTHPAQLLGLFSNDAALIQTGIPCVHAYYAAYFMMSFQTTGQNTFVALNKPKYAVFFSMLRKLFLVVPLTLLLPRLGLGVMGVFYAEMLSQIIGASLCFLTMYRRVYKKLPTQGSLN
ncbi:MAG: MATE family efflux transporter [Firmicutes bacterium]|nr:MATE family efflux transporter [Bacillota bacterium]